MPQAFFDTLESLDDYSIQLGKAISGVQCQHCQCDTQWVSHGFVYKKSHSGKRDAVGKRVLCSGRGHKGGCGRTIRLYLSSRVPRFQYSVNAFFTFMKTFLLVSVDIAYQQATGCSSSRHAYRWLNRLYQNIGRYRYRIPMLRHAVRKQMSKRLAVLMETVSGLVQQFYSGESYQYSAQEGLVVL